MIARAAYGKPALPELAKRLSLPSLVEAFLPKPLKLSPASSGVSNSLDSVERIELVAFQAEKRTRGSVWDLPPLGVAPIIQLNKKVAILSALLTPYQRQYVAWLLSRPMNVANLPMAQRPVVALAQDDLFDGDAA
ncbi:MAG: hypothetical protein PHS32_01140 [Rhodoferax sp.]|uniref:hypothetical protein n=1 Tax=Rhodoferax sp. TaxID=50421 RepID=UPI002615AE9B|nr:hypothetical protein [Rhodoferax sp.]MDD5332323.1 hypothetical protein [Rhodoferax sp.]